MHYPLTDIQADFEINQPVRYQITTKRNYFHGRQTDGQRSFFSKKEKATKKVHFEVNDEMLLIHYLLFCEVLWVLQN